MRSGNADLGFVAFSQLRGPEGEARGGSRWVVPAGLHAPIEQQAVLLRDTAAGRDFIDFVRGEAGRAIIASRGYAVP